MPTTVHTFSSILCWIPKWQQQQQQFPSNTFIRGLAYRPGPHQHGPVCLCGEADAAALHADFQAIWGLTASIHYATVHVTRAVAVVAQIVGAAAAAANLWCACTAWGLGHHHVAKRQELTEKAGQDAVNAAVWVQAGVTNKSVTNHTQR